ncbi:NPC intracellular cholesterol transporter 2-like isoform X2 [Tribolium madens]|uniref:NPC intracellular cholesterol transporter 2-like isoform X2 n=1 Tax=Tribolium madens TaxID=41895 RepID=UPI001CF7246C|nr:NPC intracellular cholesterol transporter 2-like isoform X2 [Tribolium madens]
MQLLYKNLLCVASFLLCFHFAHSIDILECGSYWTYENVTIENCSDEDTSCPLTIGTNTSISFVLNTGLIDISGNIINDVAFYINGNMKFALSVTPDDPCDILKCPLEINYKAVFSAQIFVSPQYPPLSARVKWIMKTEKDDQLMCFSFPVTLYPEDSKMIA